MKTSNGLFATIAITSALLITANAQVPFTNSLVAYYPLNGNANDASGNGHNGTVFGAATFGVDRNGNTNSCISLPGTAGNGSGVDIPSLSNLPYLPVTYSAWFVLNNYVPQSFWVDIMPLVGREAAGNQSEGSIAMLLEPGASVNNDLVYFGGAHNAVTGKVPPTNQWCQVILTIDASGNIDFYFDGTNISSAGSVPAGQPLDFRIGCSSGGNDGSQYVWNGLIDDVRIYNRALSPTEAQQLYEYEAPTNPISILEQPQSLLVNAHTAASFSVTATGAAALSYQWSFDNTNIPGATSSNLTISNVVQTNLGTYAVLVSNVFGAVTSSNAVLSMYPFLAQPFNGLDTYWGYTNSLSVVAWGTGPLDYQWFDDGVAIEGATNAQFTFTGIQPTNAGFYAVVVSNALGSVTNTPEQVVVNPAGVSLSFSPTLTISGVAGYTYTIQDTTNLSNTNAWETVTNLTLTQPVQIWVDTNVDASSPFNPTHFYQVLPGQ